MIFGWTRFITEIWGDWRTRPISQWFPIIELSRD